MDTVENVCNSLVRYKVLEADAMRSLRARWREHTGERSELVAEFKRWLVRTGRVTDFQLDLLTRGHGEHLYIEEYKLLDRIGKGRNSGVYQAVHSVWGQTVAIKVLPPSKAKNAHLVSRFLREARLAFRLDHDNVVRTFHFGQTKENMYYIVMEYLDGETMDEMLKRRKHLPVAEATALVIQAMQGVAHLEEKGLIHRDLKPANMILVPVAGEAKQGNREQGIGNREQGIGNREQGIGNREQEQEQGIGNRQPESLFPVPGSPFPSSNCTLKILDIGLSRALFDEGDPKASEGAELTRIGGLLGTTNYMAPEQARDPHAADIRADIYSMGCVFYELLTGQPPFADNNLARQIRRHAQEKPRRLAEVVPGIPESLDAIVQKMLAKDPALRYQTPGQVVKDLRGFLNRESGATATAVPGDPASTSKPARPLRTYMTWLETKRTAEPEGDPAAPSLVQQPAPPRVVRSSTGTMLEPSPPPPVVPPAPVPANVPPAVLPANLVSTTGAAPSAASMPSIAEASVKSEPSLAGTVGELIVSVFRLLKAILLLIGRLTWRDWLCLVGGAAAALAVQELWKLLGG